MLNLFFPKLCNGCKNRLLENEKILCISCRHELPLACFHKTNDPKLLNLFYGRFPIKAATTLLFFQKKEITQEILHNLKYRNQQKISDFFGIWLGEELKNIHPYTTVDIVIPVPLHKKRLKERGYNQVEGFGKELAKALKVTYVDTVLVKESKTSSQVFKQRLKRFENEAIFTLKNSSAIKNKHILLVDDIVTTGATLENCALQLLKVEGVTISIATIAIA